jgi:PAS domain-containing protein
MWALRILTGPQAGSQIDLKSGKNKFGRAPTSDFQFQSDGISKEHFEIAVYTDKMVLSDLKSSNGTFVNGVKVQNALLRVGDRLAAHNILMDIVFAVEQAIEQVPAPQIQKIQKVRRQTSLSQTNQRSLPQNSNSQVYQQPTFAQAPMYSQPPPQAQAPYYPEPAPSRGFFGGIEDFIENVVMPALYQLPKSFEFRTVIFGFGVVFVFVLTLLSLFPMRQITAETVQTESSRRAITVARALAATNERAIRSQNFDQFNTELQVKEEGVEDVYVLSKEGRILAPAERAGTSPTNAGFARTVISENRIISANVEEGRIGAAVPILVFDPEIQQQIAKAYSVVIYNPAGLSFDDQRALSLFVQMLSIALFVGFLMFYLLNRLFEYPFRHLNERIDLAMRERRDNVTLDIQMPVLQEVLVNVNSLLSRLSTAQESVSDNVSPAQRALEISNVVQLLGYPCLMVNKDQMITYISPAFEGITGVSASQLINQALQFLPDQAMQKNILELIEQARAQNQMIHQDRIPIGGDPYQVSCQSLSVSADSDLFLVVFSPFSAAEGGAA